MNFSSSSTTRIPSCSSFLRSFPEQRIPTNGSPGLSRTTRYQSLFKLHLQVWRPASSILNRPEEATDCSAALMACTTRRRHHHVTYDLHHPRGFSPPRWLPSVQTRACCSSAGQDSFPFTPSSSRYTSVSTGLGRACNRSQLPAPDCRFTRQRSKVRAHPPKNSTRQMRLVRHARLPRCYQRFRRAHRTRSLRVVGSTAVSDCRSSTSRSSSSLGTVLCSNVAAGVTKHSPSMGSLVTEAFQLQHLLQGSQRHHLTSPPLGRLHPGFR